MAWVLVRPGSNRFVVATYLSVVAVLEVEGELHQGIGDVSGGLIGEGALCCCSVGYLRRAIGAYSSISFLVRKLLPSMTTVSTWWRTRSRMAEVSVLSLLKICGQYL